MVARSERYYKNGASFESFVGPGKGTKDLFFCFVFCIYRLSVWRASGEDLMGDHSSREPYYLERCVSGLNWGSS